MKKLHFVYEMKLTFDQPIMKHAFKLRCVPLTEAGQNIYAYDCRVAPDGKIWYSKDWFGNQVINGWQEDCHSEFHVRAEGVAFVNKKHKERTGYLPIYRYASVMTGTDAKMDLFFHANIGNCESDPKDIAVRLMHAVAAEFTYQKGVTGILTSAAEAFEQKAGVCQDYSHVMLALLRKAGIPCRYVAGMLVGEGETHAWVECYLDGTWIGFDPTHDCMVDERYIKLSQGRDYCDCRVNRGVFKGICKQTQHISAMVKEL